MATDPPARILPPMWLSVGPLAASMWCAFVANDTRDARAITLTVVFGFVSYGVGVLHLLAAARELRRQNAALADAIAVRDREAHSYRLATNLAQLPKIPAPGPPRP